MPVFWIINQVTNKKKKDMKTLNIEYAHQNPSYFSNEIHKFLISDLTGVVLSGKADGTVCKVEMQDFLRVERFDEVNINIKIDGPLFEATLQKIKSA